MSQHSLVSYILFAYNQERYIREAVESAFAQFYSPLEIILSDDCSSDNTFLIMKQMSELYSGPHKVILNKNPANFGIGKHISTLMPLCSGELIVIAAGDDISVPERTQTIYEHWINNDKPSALCSDFLCMDSKGNILTGTSFNFQNSLQANHLDRDECLRLFITEKRFSLFGCTEAWSRKLFEYFGPLRSGVVAEDAAIAFRAWLVDRIIFISDKLVHYRLHDDNICNKNHKERNDIVDYLKREENSQKWSRWGWELWTGYLEDFSHYFQKLSVAPEMLEEIQISIVRQIKLQKIKMEWWSFNIYQRIIGCLVCFKIGGSAEFRARAVRLLPLRFFIIVRKILQKLKLSLNLRFFITSH